MKLNGDKLLADLEEQIEKLNRIINQIDGIDPVYLYAKHTLNVVKKSIVDGDYTINEDEK